MPAPLAAGYREEPLWSAQCPPTPIERSALPPSADVVVVGGGYCGLAAAAELADRGREVVLLEREHLGWGASTRNGGMVIPELKGGPAAAVEHHGELGRRMWTAVNEAFDFVERLIDERGIDCDYERTGQLYLAHHPAVVPLLRAAEREAHEFGEPARFVPGEDLADEVGSGAFPAGLVLERTGGLHPARFHAGLVSWALESGASLHPRTPATAVSRRPGGGLRVETRQGAIDAGDVVVATNAYADGLVAPLRRRVLPVGSFIIATEPLPPELAAGVSPRRRMLVDTRTFLHYWRLSPDRRVVFGGRRSLAPVDVAEARDFLYDDMVAIHPQLAGIAVEYAWGGVVAMTLDRLPHVGRIDGVFYATGCNGSGVALNPWLGVRVGAHLTGEAPPPFAELRHRPIPLWGLRRMWMPLVGGFLRWRDRHPRRQAASAAQKSPNTST